MHNGVYWKQQEQKERNFLETFLISFWKKIVPSDFIHMYINIDDVINGQE